MRRIRPTARSRSRVSKSATCWVRAKVLAAATRKTRRAKALAVKALVARLVRRKVKALAARKRAKAPAAKATIRKVKEAVVRKTAKANAAKVAAAAPLKFLHT